jgi:aminopeptidase N
MLFHFRTKVRFLIDDEAIDREITVDKKQHDFYFALPKEPSIVRFDPGYGLLAEVKFNKPTAMLYAQLENQEDVIGQLLAIEALDEKKDKKTIARLKEALNNDPFYGIRKEASSALCDIHTDEAFDALAESLDQPDARVRQQVVEDIGGFYRPESFELMRQVLKSEKNPEILAEAIHYLGRYRDKDTRRRLIRYLRSDSYRNRLADRAISAIHMLDDASYVGPLHKVLRQREQAFTSGGFAGALNTLAHISRDEEDKTEVRDFLVGYVNHPKRRIQAGAIRALGTLGDPKAIPIVETFSGDDPRNWVERSAERALQALREKKKFVPDEIIQLRETVDELKEETEKLKDELEDIKKRLDTKKEGATGQEGADASESEQQVASDESDQQEGEK